MKRRNFITLLGMGVTALLGTKAVANNSAIADLRVWYKVEEYSIHRQVTIDGDQKWLSGYITHKEIRELKWSQIKKGMEIYLEEVSECNHADAFAWNPHNQAFQCHKCGEQLKPYIADSEGYVTEPNGYKVWTVDVTLKDSKNTRKV